MDHQLPDRRRREDAPRDRLAKLRRAVTALKDAAARQEISVDFHLDPDLEMVVMTSDDGGQRRVLRRVDQEEALRLAELLGTGKLQLLDRRL